MEINIFNQNHQFNFQHKKEVFYCGEELAVKFIIIIFFFLR